MPATGIQDGHLSGLLVEHGVNPGGKFGFIKHQGTSGCKNLSFHGRSVYFIFSQNYSFHFIFPIKGEEIVGSISEVRGKR